MTETADDPSQNAERVRFVKMCEIIKGVYPDISEEDLREFASDTIARIETTVAQILQNTQDINASNVGEADR